MSSTLPAAMSTVLRPVLDGPVRPARVLGVFPSAVYLAAGDDGALVAVLTNDALRLPCAAVLAAPSRAYDLRAVAEPGGSARVGAGRVELTGLTVHAGRWWVPPSPRPWPAAPTLPAGTDHDTPLARALATADLPAAGKAAMSLLGRGEGLTPEGDDVLAGVLVTAAALPGHHPVAVTARHLAGLLAEAAARRTTALSADLLAHAARGHGVPPLLDLVDALGGRGDPATALRRLLTVGHTSGAALARGCLTAARAATAYAATPHRLEVA